MLKKVLFPAVPYVAVSLGLLVFHNAWLAILGYHAGVIAIVLIARPGIPARQILTSNNCRIPAIAGLVGGSSGVLMHFLWPLITVPDIASLLPEIGLTEQTWPLFLAYHVAVNPLLEEYYWRGYLGSDARRPELNDLLWAGYHLIVTAGRMETAWLFIAFVILSLTAWAWRQANRLSKGLLPSLVSHTAADITIVLAIYLAVR